MKVLIHVDLEPGTTRVQHIDFECRALGEHGTFLRLLPHNSSYMVVRGDDGEEFQARTADWEVVA